MGICYDPQLSHTGIYPNTGYIRRMRNFPHNPDHKTLVSLLRELRLENNMIQSEVAEKLGRPQSFVAKYENSERRLDFVDVYYISKALKISLNELCARFERKVQQSKNI